MLVSTIEARIILGYSLVRLPGEGGTPLFGLYGYVPLDGCLENPNSA